MQKTSKKEFVQHTSLSSPLRYYPSGLPDLLPFVSPHWHNEFELNFIRSGTGIFYRNGKQLLAKAGDIFIFQPNQTHSMTTLDNQKVSYDTLLFNSNIFGSQSEQGNHLVISPLVSGKSSICQPISSNCEGYSMIRATVESIFNATIANDAASDILVKSDLLRLFYYLHIYGHIESYRSAPSADESKIRPVLTYIDQHYTEDLTVEFLSQQIALSKSYFMSCFKRVTGTSLVTYINQIRVRNACEILLTTDAQVMQVALECGFDNLSNFNRQFRKHTGCSPSQYRTAYSANAKSTDE